jgi:electron transfer flavoprotein beta subunit
LEAALELKDKNPDTEVVVMTMGLPKAAEMLKEGVAMGADKGVLLTDRVLGGSDTCALAAALKKVGFDLVIAGRQAIDGDTAQVGPQTAERLDIPQITYVDEILEVKEDSITVKRSLEDVEQIVTAKLPCVITTLSGMNKPRYMQCDNIVDLCKEDKIEVLTNAELGIDPETVGFKGSPTSVKTTFTKDVTDKTEVFTLSEQETADMIAKTLKEKQIITK